MSSFFLDLSFTNILYFKLLLDILLMKYSMYGFMLKGKGKGLDT